MFALTDFSSSNPAILQPTQTLDTDSSKLPKPEQMNLSPGTAVNPKRDAESSFLIGFWVPVHALCFTFGIGM